MNIDRESADFLGPTEVNLSPSFPGFKHSLRLSLAGGAGLLTVLASGCGVTQLPEGYTQPVSVAPSSSIPKLPAIPEPEILLLPPNSKNPEPVCFPDPLLTDSDRESYLKGAGIVNNSLIFALEPEIQKNLKSLQLGDVLGLATRGIKREELTQEQHDRILCDSFAGVTGSVEYNNQTVMWYDFGGVALMFNNSELRRNYGLFTTGDLRVEVIFEQPTAIPRYAQNIKQFKVEFKTFIQDPISFKDLNRIIESWFLLPQSGVRSEKGEIISYVVPKGVFDARNKILKIDDKNALVEASADQRGSVSYSITYK